MTSHPSGTIGGHDVVEPLPSATIRRPGGRDGDHVPTSRIRHKKAAQEARL